MKRLTPELLGRTMRFLWALVLVFLPVTSFRYLPFMGSGTQVRPLSLIPAALLLVLLLVQSYRERRLLVWNNSLIPLFAFVLAAVLSSVAGFLLAPVDLYQFSYSNRLVRAWITLVVGLVFYIVSIKMVRDETDLKFTFKWLYIGFVAQVAWSLVQLFGFYVLEVYFNPPIGELVDTIQKAVMVTGLAPNERISGLTLEPSWLAAQVVALYLPWVFASVVKNYRWDQRRWLAPLVLAASAFLIIFTYSRSGLLTAVAVIFLSLIFSGGDRIKQGWRWLFKPFRHQDMLGKQRILNIATRLVIFAVVLGGMVAGAVILSGNEYFSTIWQSLATAKNPVDYFVDIYAGPRFAYAAAGWTVFEQHPWTGVGVGGLGLYLHQALPDWAHFNIPEIAQLLSSGNTMYPNAKNMYIRLLAENGIVGFWLFVSFYLFILGKILKLLRSSQKDAAFIGVAGLFAWLAIVALGISQDSYAMPVIWVPLGIIMGFAETRT